MTERFDTELRRSFREHSERTLKGFEFDVAMQERVLQQIRAEESGRVASTNRPARRGPTWKQAAWITAAAAAFVIAIRIGTFGFGAAGSRAPSAASAPSASAPAAGASPMAAPMAAPAPKPAPAAPAAPAPGTAPQSVAAAPAAPAPAPAAPPSGTATATAVPTDPNAPVPTIQAMGVRGYPVLQLALPAPKAAVGAPENVPTVGPRMDLTAPARTLALIAAPQAGEARELSQVGVSALDSHGAQLWLQPLAGINENSRMAVGADGRIAVSTGTQVSVLSPTGVLQRTISLAAGSMRLAWSPDGRLAVLLETGVYVYGPDRLQYSVPGLKEARIRFGADGAMAVLGRRDGAGTLLLFDAAGNRILEVAPEPTARALAFSSDATMVLAGSRMYDRTGHVRWQAPFEPTDALPLPGPNGLLLWNGQSALAVDAATGAARWRADWNGSPGIGAAAVSADGGHVALTAPTETGGGLWILQSDGGMLLSETLPSSPGPLAFAGDQLLFEMNGSLQVRSVQP